MQNSTKTRRVKTPAREVDVARFPGDLRIVRRCHNALHVFAEQLRGELDEAVRNAKARSLGPARRVEAIGRYLLDHQPARQAAKATVLAVPTGISIGPNLALALKYVDVAALAECVDAWSQIVADLASYEGVPFPRKPLAISGRKHRQGGAAAERDTEQQTVASLEREAESLLGVLRDAAAKFERRLIAGSTKRKQSNGGSSKLLHGATGSQAAGRRAGESAGLDRKGRTGGDQCGAGGFVAAAVADRLERSGKI